MSEHGRLLGHAVSFVRNMITFRTICSGFHAWMTSYPVRILNKHIEFLTTWLHPVTHIKNRVDINFGKYICVNHPYRNVEQV